MLSGPSSTTWRRQRLLAIGQGGSAIPASPDETTTLGRDSTEYGSIPPNNTVPSPSATRRGFRSRHRLPALPHLDLPHGAASASNPTSPRTPMSFSFRDIRDSQTYFRQRPISAYDSNLVKDLTAQRDAETDGDSAARSNGIRVWYSSFTSIDWLHDAIKDSVRRSRLHRRKSVRGKIRLAVDRSIGWIIVTIVGILTAISAFLIARSEQVLFDWKEGYCTAGWWKARRFCCPTVDEDVIIARQWASPLFVTQPEGDEPCAAWRVWSDLFDPRHHGEGSWLKLEAEMVEYVTYTVVALVLALISTLLTIHLTASTSFITRKDSGVLAPDFPENDNDKPKPAQSDAPDPRRKVMYYAAGSGIPEIKTILSGFVIHGYLGARTLFTKSVGLALSVASGLSLGKEGPFVHIASCIGNIVSRFFNKYENNEAKRREILSAASAAGVAVAFGAPIGGVLFSLEEVSYFFPPKVMWRSFFCAMIAAITLRFLDPFGTGKLVLFQVTYDKDWHAYELVFFLLLGILGGIYGAYFSKLNFRWSRDVRNRTWMKTHPVFEVLLITLITALGSFLNPYTRMGGTELVYNLFAECRAGSGNTHYGLCVLDPPTQAVPVIRAIFIALLVKGALTIVTFGIKLPAGIFIPTLGVGACAGRIMGILVQWGQWKYPDSGIWFKYCRGDLDCVVPGLYAMVGAAAALSGVTRTTVSLAVIMFELTDTLTYAVPVMLSVLVAKTVADALEPKGIYDLVIDLNQLPYLDGKHDPLWGDLQISDVVNRDVEVIRVDRENTVKSLCDQLQQLLSSGTDDSGFPILRPDDRKDGGGMRMIGYIGASELEHALSIVADEADSPVSFRVTQAHQHGDITSSSISSLAETSIYAAGDPFDFSVYMDQAPLTVQSNAPLELIQEFFVKLGTRHVMVTDTDGCYEGVIDKKTWLHFVTELEERKH
ncbi:hypothetical protein PUNSTDRAFT_61841 [Punctularia strigosozonata HHB-11173 SS5]|uniref:uncharacterized protein n=1 Tax=Punctularia strigosozonata (strain HHB-11173) TaxID=741275 RepID=UPI000441638B|nr:uncharacterized protein PUNSTDRAFT_61841 [Punctularia strigosozonata HHB-11173 SS5]EIN11917.1 hypothetical protein PUNSTDRAFT_61841 [Punctularia strigosozonata HHB-11173 SS5]